MIKTAFVWHFVNLALNFAKMFEKFAKICQKTKANYLNKI